MTINENKYNVLYYVVSEQHINNSKILFKNTKFNIFYIFENNLKIINKEILKKNKIKHLAYNGEKNLNTILKNIKFNFFFVSTTQLRPLPILLIIEAHKRRIPIYASQEVHQMFLHQNEINNYLMPVDTFSFHQSLKKINIKN